MRITKTQPPQASKGNVPTVRVPNRVSQDYIVRVMKPIFQSKGALRIESYFMSINSTMVDKNKNKNNNNLNSLACKAMFGSLQLKPEVQEVVESMVQKLRSWSKNSNGQFIAVDLKTEMCDGKADQRGRKGCYKAEEIGQFLKKVGFSQETAVYVTQPRWHSDLDALRDIFPKTYTKVFFYDLHNIQVNDLNLHIL